MTKETRLALKASAAIFVIGVSAGSGLVVGLDKLMTRLFLNREWPEEEWVDNDWAQEDLDV